MRKLGKLNFREWFNKLPDKPVAEFYDWYTDKVKSPLVTTGLLAAGTYGAARYLTGPFVDTARALFRRPGAAFLGYVGEDGEKLYNEAFDEMKESKMFPWIASGLAALGHLWSRYDAKKPGYGITKYGSFDGPMSYMGDLDWQQQVNVGVANGLFANDSHFDNDPYAKHMGMSIVNNAAIVNSTNAPTLGNVFDSAVDKFDTKFTMGGVIKAGTRAVAANAAARMFTAALGSMCDLNPVARQNIVDAGTWAGAISTLFD